MCILNNKFFWTGICLSNYKFYNMKKLLIICGGMMLSSGLYAQLHSGNMNAPATAQPVPNATVTEKSAQPQPLNIPPAPNPVAPIYPGAEVEAAEVQRQIINPPSTPIATQPVQKEPLSPIESTNTLQPTRPQRSDNARKATTVTLEQSPKYTGLNKKATERVSKSSKVAVIKTERTNNALRINSTVKKETKNKKVVQKKHTVKKPIKKK